MGRITGRLFVLFTSLLISFIAYSSQIYIIWPWYGRELSVDLLTLLVPFNLLVGMLWWNYYLAVVTEPGHVPSNWKPDVQNEEGYEVKKLTRGPRYCRTCESFKPPRSHHCRQCKRHVVSSSWRSLVILHMRIRRCVLRMDHHCPWVNNCVGHFNYGHFIRFLFYVDLACLYHFTMVTKRVLHFTDARYFDEPTGQELIFMILNYTFCIPVLLAVGGFSIYHFYMMSGNSTTIEGWEKDKAATLVRRGKIKEIKFPYNLGMRRNIASVLGDNPWLWCWPTKPSGTGLKYQLAEGHDPSSLDEDWPPKDPSTYNMPETDPNYVLQIPDSPWTYNNGTLNPSFLAGSSGSVRKRKVNNRVSHVPPYHPDFGKPPPPGDSDASWDDTSEEEEAEDESSSPPRFNDGYEYSETPSGIRKRRGSEGYEVGPIDRVALLRQHVAETTAEPGRYNWYLPTRDYDIESSDSENEDVPLVNGSGNGTEVKTS